MKKIRVIIEVDVSSFSPVKEIEEFSASLKEGAENLIDDEITFLSHDVEIVGTNVVHEVI